MQQSGSRKLLDHLVGTCEQCRDNVSPSAFAVQIENKLEFGWLFNWEVPRPRPLHNLVDVVSRAPSDATFDMRCS